MKEVLFSCSCEMILFPRLLCSSSGDTISVRLQPPSVFSVEVTDRQTDRQAHVTVRQTGGAAFVPQAI